MNDCRNCRHKEVDIETMPCLYCLPIQTQWTHWQPVPHEAAPENLPAEALAILNSANSPEHTGPLTPYVERLCELLSDERALCDRLADSITSATGYARPMIQRTAINAHTAHRAKETNHG